jgi:iron(III) transport system ATP-binding protein
MNELEITGLHKSFATQGVLGGVELVVEKGSFTSILGPSGSGKTTLLRIVAGLERADAGTVRLGGEVVDDGEHYVAPERRRIGYVPQDGSLFPHLPVAQNVGFGLPRRVRHGRRVGELIEMVGLGGLERRFPHQLSGGQQQRVALARALAIEPVLVLLDEPFSSLDASFRSSVRQDVRRALRQAGTTALLVTHDQDEALSLSDHVAVIADRCIGQHATPEELYADPASPELARGVGEANFLHGTLRGDVAATPLGALHLAHEPATWRGGGARNGAASADALLVLVRPEQLLLSVEPTGGPVTAHVVDAEFYGHDAVVRLQADWDASFLLTARVSEARSLPAKGTALALSVRGDVVAWRDVAPSGAPQRRDAPGT